MKVAALLKVHQGLQHRGLAGNFGDGYLMEHNRVYRQVRSSALAGGYRFSLERDEGYEVFPLLQLERLLREKVFPYSNNVRVFEAMAPKGIDVLVWEDLVGNLKRNFVFHEGAHGVVRDLVQRHFGATARGSTLESQQGFVLRVLLEESFANTAELLGVIDAADATHRAFYELNSYNTMFEHRANLKKAMDEMGAELLIPFLMLSYLHANFLRESLGEGDLKKIFLLTGGGTVDAGHLKSLKAVGKLAFKLSETFRYQTTAFHLKTNGIKTPLDEVLAFDFLAELGKQRGLSAFWKQAVSSLWGF